VLDIAKRIADLPPEKRLLLEQLFEHKISIPPQNGTVGKEAARTYLPKNLVIPHVKSARPEPEDLRLAVEKHSSFPLSKTGYRNFYNAISEQLNSTEFGGFSFFLNYGYVPAGGAEYSRVRLPDQYLNKNSVRLVLEVLDDCAINGRRVLDVGCGRGGTVHVIHKFFSAASITGVDLSSAAISFCSNILNYPEAVFLEADAEALPFDGECFDVVTNIESSHSYPEIDAFYSQVFRVLTVGGKFLYTDVLPVRNMKECVSVLKHVGFTIERERDVTANVLLSCDEVARDRTTAFDRSRDPELVDEFLGLPGSEVYEDLRHGKSIYKIFKLKKTQRRGVSQ
jgi:phthiocerol/phenolphthiocerol synthesis type-I polyketide synthase E